jgi:hypothetical protein
MDITITRMYKVSNEFDYVATKFDNATKYGVWFGGRAPLNGLPGHGYGQYVGDVFRYSNDVAYPTKPWDKWYASPDKSSDAVNMRWFGPFKTRRNAALWLVGYRRGALSSDTE